MPDYHVVIVHHGGPVVHGRVRYASRANAREAIAKLKFDGATSHPSGSPDARLVKRDGAVIATVAVERVEEVKP